MMKPKTKKALKALAAEVEVTAIFFLIIFSVWGIQLTTANFYLGFHNLDRGWNLMVLNEVHNLTFVEVGAKGIEIGVDNTIIATPGEAIITGNLQMQFSFVFVGLAYLMLGLSVMMLLNKVKRS